MSKVKSEGAGSYGSSTDNTAHPEVLVVDLEEKATSACCMQLSNNGSIPNGKAAPAAEDSTPDVLEVFPMTYHNIRLKLFKMLGSPCRYFYSPLVMLDPRSIQAQVDKATGEAYVRFTIQMWDTEVEGQVLNWLKRLPESQDVEDYCVQTMPYEEVRLVMRSGSMASTAFRTPKFPTAYHGLTQTLQFHLICDSKEMGDSVAESFKSDPTFAIQDLALECAPIGVSSTAEPRRKMPRVEDDAVMGGSFRWLTYLKVNVWNPDDVPANGLSQVHAVVQKAEEHQLNEKLEGLEENVKQLTAQFGGIGLVIKGEFDKLCADLKETLDQRIAELRQQDMANFTTQIADLNGKMKELADNNRTVIPVFSASGLQTSVNGSVTYQALDFNEKAHGAFDASTGLFTATSAGLYLFFFSGTSWLDHDAERACPTCIELRVDGQRTAVSQVSCFGQNGTLGYNFKAACFMCY